MFIKILQYMFIMGNLESRETEKKIIKTDVILIIKMHILVYFNFLSGFAIGLHSYRHT